MDVGAQDGGKHMEERTHVLNGAGYARYDESTSAKSAKPRTFCSIDMMATCAVCAKKPRCGERARLIQQFKAIGPVCADISAGDTGRVAGTLSFCRRRRARYSQTIEDQRYGSKSRYSVERDDFPRLVAALVRTILR